MLNQVNISFKSTGPAVFNRGRDMKVFKKEMDLRVLKKSDCKSLDLRVI